MVELRQYAIVRTTSELLAAYLDGKDKAERLRALTVDLLRASGAPPALWQARGGFGVVDAPSLDWQLDVVGEHPPPPSPDSLVIAYACPTPELVTTLRATLLAPD